MSSSINERLAVVETKLQEISREAHAREQTQLDMLDKIDELKTSLADLNSTLSRYKGFVGGVVFVATAVGTFLFKFIAPIWAAITGKNV